LPPAGTLRPQRGQPKVDLGKSLAVLVEVGQRKGRAQPLVILFQSAITHFRKSKDALQNAKRPLHLRAHFCLGPVLALLHFIHARFCFHTPRGHVLRLRRGLVNRFALALITRIALDLALVPCGNSGNICTSETLAAVEQTECTMPSFESTPMCAFMPKWRVGRRNLTSSRSQNHT